MFNVTSKLEFHVKINFVFSEYFGSANEKPDALHPYRSVET